MNSIYSFIQYFELFYYLYLFSISAPVQGTEASQHDTQGTKHNFQSIKALSNKVMTSLYSF